MKCSAFMSCLSFLSLLVSTGFGIAADTLPEEPVEIGNEPQFLFDNYIVDNHWAIKYKREAVTRVFHQAVKHPANPIMTGDQQSFLWVIRDESADVFRMYYQANFRNSTPTSKKGRQFRTHIAA